MRGIEEGYKEYTFEVESTNAQTFWFDAKSQEEAEELLWQELSEQCISDHDQPLTESWVENAKIIKVEVVE